MGFRQLDFKSLESANCIQSHLQAVIALGVMSLELLGALLLSILLRQRTNHDYHRKLSQTLTVFISTMGEGKPNENMSSKDDEPAICYNTVGEHKEITILDAYLLRMRDRLGKGHARRMPFLVSL